MRRVSEINHKKNPMLLQISTIRYTFKPLAGIHSAAAAVASASVVLSFDRQTDSLTSTRALQQRYGSQISKATRWDAYLGDILKKEDLDHRTQQKRNETAKEGTHDVRGDWRNACEIGIKSEELTVRKRKGARRRSTN